MFRYHYHLFFLWLLAAVGVTAASPIQLDFTVPASDQDPFARELSARVRLPDRTEQELPAFFLEGERFAVRAGYVGEGEYRLVSVSELINGAPADVSQARLAKPVQAPARETLPFVRRDPAQPTRFVSDRGGVYFPVGMNMAWPDGGPDLAYYRDGFARMQAAGLNWSRVWMCHWGELNLDWLPDGGRPSPRPGTLDPAVAARWDEVIALAEKHGIYLQIVLQHHGQYSTRVNSNWAEHPWNAANPGGFLRRPQEFFTSEEARRHTRAKYRTIAARWGASPAVLAWELFNEVHYTDAMETPAGEAQVAAWHAEMAGVLRRADAYRHLVTTSLQDFSSPVYAAMDYTQPHLYAPNMLAAIRLLPGAPTPLRGPAFWGECGDEQMTLTPEQTRTAVALVPIAWASLFGAGTHPAQIWYGDRMLATNRVPELGALARIVQAVRLGERGPLTPRDVPVSSGERQPMVLLPGHWWAKTPNPTITLVTDGREPASYGRLPRVLVNRADGRRSGFPWKATLHLKRDEPTTVALEIEEAEPGGAVLVATVNGREAARQDWTRMKRAAAEALPRTATLDLVLPAGASTLELENVGSFGPLYLNQTRLGYDVPRLAATATGNADFLLAWIWNRDGVFSVEEGSSAAATIHLDDLPAGVWRCTWWNTFTGVALVRETHRHGGGRLSLGTPPVPRHCAVSLERIPGSEQ